MDRCFEFDFKCSNIARFVKDEKEIAEIKALLKKEYTFIYSGFKWFSSKDNRKIFSVGGNSLQVCCEKLDVFGDTLDKVSLNLDLLAIF
jgi:hypothetical protein